MASHLADCAARRPAGPPARARTAKRNLIDVNVPWRWDDWIWHAERVARLPSEAGLQHAFLAHPLLVQAFNVYYAVLHFPVLIGCMIWLFVRHQASWRSRPSAG